MKRDVRLSKRAEKRLESLLVYLEKEWSAKVKHEFIQKLDKSLVQIQKYPDSFPVSGKISGLRKCLITRQTTMFYKYSDTTVDVVIVFDDRQSPESLIEKQE